MINGILYFSADDGLKGVEIWKTKGKGSNTYLVKDINEGYRSGSNPKWLVNFNGTLFFSADNGVRGFELFKSDGSKAGTHRVKDIFPGAGGSFPKHLVPGKRRLFFSANDGVHGRELWVYWPTLIFADGFESGDLSAWSGAIGAGGPDNFSVRAFCFLCVSPTIPIEGAYDLVVSVINRDPHFLRDRKPSNENHYRARFYIDLRGLSMSEDSKFVAFKGRMGKKSPFHLVVRKLTGKYWVKAILRSDDGDLKKTKWYELPDKPNSIEIDWKAAKSETNHNGYLKLWINGDLMQKKGVVVL